VLLPPLLLLDFGFSDGGSINPIANDGLLGFSSNMASSSSKVRVEEEAEESGESPLDHAATAAAAVVVSTLFSRGHGGGSDGNCGSIFLGSRFYKSMPSDPSPLFFKEFSELRYREYGPRIAD